MTIRREEYGLSEFSRTSEGSNEKVATKKTSSLLPSITDQKNPDGRPSTVSATWVDGVAALGVENSQPRSDTTLFIVSPEKLSVLRPA